MLAITLDSILKLHYYACTAMAISCAACGLGIACDVWFLLRYGWVDLGTFIVRSTFPTPTPHELILLPYSTVPVTYIIHTSSSHCPHAYPPSAR